MGSSGEREIMGLNEFFSSSILLEPFFGGFGLRSSRRESVIMPFFGYLNLIIDEYLPIHFPCY